MTESQNQQTLDLRDLPPPEPMIRVLERVATLSPNETLIVHHSRIPRLLYPRLKERGLIVTTDELANDHVLLTIRRPE